MDLLADLLQWWRVASLENQHGSLEERVKNLEQQLQVMRNVVRTLIVLQHAELAQLLDRPAVAAWYLVRVDDVGQSTPMQSSFGTEEEAAREARRLLQDDPQGHVFVRGPEGQAYRIWP